VLRTRTTTDTIHAALAAPIEAERKRQERRQRLMNSFGSPDIADEEIMSEAWHGVERGFST
jgi:hypothetical protein